MNVTKKEKSNALTALLLSSLFVTNTNDKIFVKKSQSKNW
ncbi:hypothetical protein CLOSCI_03042 [[Clostridium] scindens ATCC 35704]|nr:hypothetical protein CLOSCI_03042 [[Clostridium] scindens ATCC 35704]